MTRPKRRDCTWCKLSKPTFEKDRAIWHNTGWAGIARCCDPQPRRAA